MCPVIGAQNFCVETSASRLKAESVFVEIVLILLHRGAIIVVIPSLALSTPKTLRMGIALIPYNVILHLVT